MAAQLGVDVFGCAVLTDTPRPSVAKSTWLPSLSPDRHLVYPLTASFAPLKRGAILLYIVDFKEKEDYNAYKNR